MFVLQDIVAIHYTPGHQPLVGNEVDTVEIWNLGVTDFGLVNGMVTSTRYLAILVARYARLIACLLKLPIHRNISVFSESQLLDSADERFHGDCTTSDPADLDLRLWQLVSDWVGIHNGFYALASRCSASLILNSTRERVNIQNISLKEGRNFKCFGTGGCAELPLNLLAM